MPNRLIDSTSPYLQQHAHNPVDWYPWGAEALERARREEKPIFLSIGYAACHWCHVMEHLVFERPDIAAVMNEHFINIKVDREERPDLDELYMLATQLMTGQGGWPMSVWLTPALEPFYAGTYFPPEDAYGRPGFPRLLLALADAWKNRQGDLLAQSQKVVEAIRLHADETQSSTPRVSQEDTNASIAAQLPQWLHLAIEQSAARFDDVNGGPMGAPKFPPHQTLQYWLGLVTGKSSQDILATVEKQILAGKIAKTLDGMMNGGIYDHVGGAFARYSTDERWLVPHFEKMLYDSAQLAPLYALAGMAMDRPQYIRIARETLDFFMREMMSEQGAFYSSLDADSEGEEGKYYVWTVADIHAALPEPSDAAKIIAHFNMTPEGNWHESPVAGGSVLATQNADASNGDDDIMPLILKLRAYRDRHVRPRLDDKILTAWNGLMLSALAQTARMLGDQKYLAAAQRLAEFLCRHHMPNGELLRVSRNGPSHTAAFLDDHAFLLNGLLDLIDSMTSPLLPNAVHLAEVLLNDFQDATHGGFFFTGPRNESLFVRMKNAADNATPSPNGVAIRALLRLARLTGEARYRDAALRAVGAFEENIDRRPEYFPTLLLGLLEEMQPDAITEQPAQRGIQNPGLLTLALEKIEPTAGGDATTREFRLAFRLTIAPGYHIQPAGVSTAQAISTTAKLTINGLTEQPAQQWSFPQPQSIHHTTGYAGTIHLETKLMLKKPPAGAYRATAVVVGQPCTENACLQPETAAAEFTLEIH